MKYLIVLMLISGCAKIPREFDLEFGGSENRFYQTQRKALGGLAAIENSFVMIDNQVVSFFDPDATGIMQRTVLNSGSVETVMPSDARFSYVTEIDGRLFNFVTRNNAIYRLESTDKGKTWTDLIQVVPADMIQWNVGVTKHQGTWHMLIEADETGLPNQQGVACYHLTSIDGISWTRTGEKIPNCGNPYLVSTPNGILSIHGVVYRPTEWHVIASTFDGTKWTEHPDKFQIGVPNVHVCDPHAIEVNGKILLSVSVDQNSISFAEANDTFESLYVRLTR